MNDKIGSSSVGIFFTIVFHITNTQDIKPFTCIIFFNWLLSILVLVCNVIKLNEFSFAPQYLQDLLVFTLHTAVQRRLWIVTIRLRIRRQKPLRFVSVNIPCYGPWICIHYTFYQLNVYIPQVAAVECTHSMTSMWDVYIPYLTHRMYTFHSYLHSIQRIQVIHGHSNYSIYTFHT